MGWGGMSLCAVPAGSEAGSASDRSGMGLAAVEGVRQVVSAIRSEGKRKRSLSVLLLEPSALLSRGSKAERSEGNELDSDQGPEAIGALSRWTRTDSSHPRTGDEEMVREEDGLRFPRIPGTFLLLSSALGAAIPTAIVFPARHPPVGAGFPLVIIAGD